MEKGMRHLARYNCGNQLFVDVMKEDTGSAIDCDYWLVDRLNNCSRFMFTDRFKSSDLEVNRIRDYVNKYIQATA